MIEGQTNVSRSCAGLFGKCAQVCEGAAADPGDRKSQLALEIYLGPQLVGDVGAI